MTDQTFAFKVGDFDCISIQDDDGTPTIKDLFGGVDDEAMQKRIEANPDDTEHLSYNVLLIDTGAQKILIDTGNGEHTGGDGRLMANLRTLEIAPENIDTVVLTHAHADHYAGMLTPEGDKVFPNATYMMWRDEWDFYTHPDQLKAAYERGTEYWEFTIKYLLPLFPRLQFLDADNVTIADGIKAFYIPGHTQHHIGVTIESNGEALIYISDASIHPLHLENPTWQWERALDKENGVKSNHAILDWVFSNEAMVMGYHFPFPGIGSVQRDNERIVFDPATL